MLPHFSKQIRRLIVLMFFIIPTAYAQFNPPGPIHRQEGVAKAILVLSETVSTDGKYTVSVGKNCGETIAGWPANCTQNINSIRERYIKNGEQVWGSGASTSQIGAKASKNYVKTENGVFSYQAYLSIQYRGVANGYDYNYSDFRNVTVVMPPSRLTAPSSDSDGAFSVSWSGISGTTKYNLQRSHNNGSWSTQYSGSGTSKSFSGLADGSYRFRVQSCVGSVCGNWRYSVTTTVKKTPHTPSSLSVPSYIYGSSATVSWGSGTYATGYELYQTVAGKNAWSRVCSGSGRSCTVKNLAHETKYQYRVRSVNSAGTSGYRTSNTQLEVVYRPGIPTLTAPANNYNGRYSVSWNKQNFATSYQLYENGKHIYSGGDLNRTLSGKGSATYKYKVRACNRKGTCSSFSGEKSVVVNRRVGVPGLKLSTTVSKDGKVTLSWNAIKHGDQTISYDVYSGSSRIATTGSTSRTLSGLANGRKYCYKVRAKTPSDTSGFSNESCVTVSLSVPSLTASPTVSHDGKYTLSWSALSGAVSYELYSGDTRLQQGSGRSKSFSGVADGTYTYRVRACYANGVCSNFSANRSVRVDKLPATPKLSVKANPSFDGVVALSWNKPTHATSFKLTDGNNKTVYSGAGTAKTLTNLATGNYSYRIQACNQNSSCSGVSAPLVVKVDRTIPTPKASMSPAFSDNGLAKLSWTKVSKGSLAITYQVVNVRNQELYRGGNLSFELKDLTNGKQCFKVRAMTPKDVSQFSQACVEVQILLPPVTPVLKAPASSQGGYKVSWNKVAHASRYELQRSANGSTWKTVLNGNVTSYTDSTSPIEFGQHRYRIRAVNKAGTSNWSATITVKVELDPTVKIRKQLYYSEADKIPAAEENPTLGKYSRELAAFRYLDLMYVVDANSQKVINRFASGDVLPEFSTLYDNFERDRVGDVESFIQLKLNELPNNTNLQRFLLDVYYDRAVAEMILVNEAVEKAKTARLRGEHVDVELEHVNRALELISDALDSYENFFDFDDNTAIFQKYAASRGMVSPRYRDKDDVAQPVVRDNERLFPGYKDVVMLYQLMNKLAQLQVQKARLIVVSGETNQTLLDYEIIDIDSQIFRMLDFSDFLLSLFPNVDFTTLEGFSGLDEAINTFYQRIDEFEVAVSWLQGDSNILGLPKDAIVFMQGYKQTHDLEHSFDAFKSILDPNNVVSTLSLAIANEQKVNESFDSYQYNRDRLATEFGDRNNDLNDRLFSLMGIEFPSGCYKSDCVVSKGDSMVGSEISQQLISIEAAEKNLEIAEDRKQKILEAIEIEIERRAAEAKIEDGISKIILKYGEKNARIQHQIAKIREREARARKKRGLFGSIVKVGIGIFTGQPQLIVGGISDGVGGMISANSEIRSTRKVGELEVMRQRLAAEERAVINDETGKILDVNSEALIRNLWLEANSLNLDIVSAEVALEAEVERLIGLLNQAQRTVNEIRDTNNRLTDRYFADPIHGQRLSADFDRYGYYTEQAQFWLYLMARALEYKWGDSTINSDQAFRLRHSDDLLDFYVRMVDFDNRHQVNATEEVKDILSLKQDIFGYFEGVDDNGEELLYAHPDPNNPTLVTASEAFSARIDQLLDQRTGKIEIPFNTVKEVFPTFFLGPYSIDDADMTCLIDGGTYLDKINTIGVHIVATPNNTRGMKLGLSYGGSHVMRTPEASERIIFDENDLPLITGDLNNYPARFWTVDENNRLTFETSQKVSLGPSVSPNSLWDVEDQPVPVTSAFDEYSVAATQWNLDVPLKNPRDRRGTPFFHLDTLEDIELVIEHHYVYRRFNECF